MRNPRQLLGLLSLLCGLGCGAEDDPNGQLEGYAQALNACDETLPANRQVDGIPAYAQCSQVAQGPIYSNNGVDTSDSPLGPDWVQTQFDGGYQCTELAHRYLLFHFQVSWLPRGNAGNWCDSAPPAASGVVQSDTPVHGDLMVFAPGSCGADATYGHVAVVDVVDGATQRLTVVEQNMARRGTYPASCARCFLHVVANQGAMSADAGLQTADGGADAGRAEPSAADAVASPANVEDAGASRDAALDAASPPIVPGAAAGGADAGTPDGGATLAVEAGPPGAGSLSGLASDTSGASGCGVRSGRSVPSRWITGLVVLAFFARVRRRSRFRRSSLGPARAFVLNARG